MYDYLMELNLRDHQETALMEYEDYLLGFTEREEQLLRRYELEDVD